MISRSFQRKKLADLRGLKLNYTLMSQFNQFKNPTEEYLIT